MSSVRRAILLAAVASLVACKGGGKSTGATGSLAANSTGTAVLSWTAPASNADGSPIRQIAGYYIFYGPSPSAMNQTIQVPDPAATSYVVRNLGTGTYYFSVAAYTISGTRGQQTEPVSKTIAE